jgi:hypothetical protein
MMGNESAFQRAMKLAVASGLKTTFGPALVAAAQDRPERDTLAMAAMGEMVLDKLPLMPSRRSLPLLLPRAIAGYWAAKMNLEHEGIDDATPAWIAAAVAAGVATFAPMVRGALHKVAGIPDPLIGLAEDYLALKLGGEAVGLSMEEIGTIGRGTCDQIAENLMPIAENLREKLQPVG